MSVDKFRFVSPGVFTQEVDNTRLPRTSLEIGPAIIGRSLRGPMMRPVRIESFADFAEDPDNAFGYFCGVGKK